MDSVDPSRPSSAADAAVFGLDGAFDGAPASERHDASTLPVPVVKLAPELEDALGCDNRELDFDFDPTSRNFNLDHAFWMMWFVERSFFSEKAETRAELATLGFDNYAEFANPDTGLQLYVAGSAGSVVVAFRGSTELNDWLGDFNFPQDDGALHGVAGRVHRGFASALSPSFDAIEETIRIFASAGQPIFVTGHSLGGAEATLAAARLARAGGVMLGPLYTYGAPRTGDATFAQDAFLRLDADAYRIVNERDLVPHIPPAAIAAEESSRVLPFGQDTGAQVIRDLDYRHVGRMAWMQVPDGTDLTLLPTMPDDDDQAYWAEAAKDGSLGLIFGSQQQGAQHAQQRYLCRLFAMREAQETLSIDP